MAKKRRSIHPFFSVKKRKEAPTSDEVNTQSLTQTRLDSAFMTHIYKDKLDSIDLNSICSTFVTRNEPKKCFLMLFNHIYFLSVYFVDLLKLTKET
jgi:hypothetical protein